jgi:surface polysaccharide O-acyltransferase-like enzyme
VLQTIGLAIIVMAPALWLLRFRHAAPALLALAVLAFLAFVALLPGVEAFVGAHPAAGQVLFYDFPPWPWLSLVLIGLVLGHAWLQAYRRSPAAGARWLAGLAALGVGLLLAFVVYDWWAATPVRLGLSRDFLLNRHRTPRGASLFWVFGMLFVGLGLSYWAMEVRRWRLRWLVVLGQTALFLYFVHQIIVYPLVNQWLGWRFNGWPGFCLANLALVVVLVGLAWAWREVRPRVRAWRPWSPAPAPATPS